MEGLGVGKDHKEVVQFCSYAVLQSHRLPSREGTGVGFFVFDYAVLQFCSCLLSGLNSYLSSPSNGIVFPGEF